MATRKRVVNADLASAWKVFHSTHAELRVVHTFANLSLLTQGASNKVAVVIEVFYR